MFHHSQDLFSEWGTLREAMFSFLDLALQVLNAVFELGYHKAMVPHVAITASTFLCMVATWWVLKPPR